MIRLALPKGRNLDAALAAFRAAGIGLGGLDRRRAAACRPRLPEEGVEVLSLEGQGPAALRRARRGRLRHRRQRRARRRWTATSWCRRGWSRGALADVARSAAPRSRRPPGAQVRLATKYPNTARRLVDERPWGAEIVKLSGSIELAPMLASRRAGAGHRADRPHPGRERSGGDRDRGRGGGLSGGQPGVVPAPPRPAQRVASDRLEAAEVVGVREAHCGCSRRIRGAGGGRSSACSPAASWCWIRRSAPGRKDRRRGAPRRRRRLLGRVRGGRRGRGVVRPGARRRCGGRGRSTCRAASSKRWRRRSGRSSGSIAAGAVRLQDGRGRRQAGGAGARRCAASPSTCPGGRAATSTVVMTVVRPASPGSQEIAVATPPASLPVEPGPAPCPGAARRPDRGLGDGRRPRRSPPWPGTRRSAEVDKIVGPGNAWWSRRQEAGVSGDVAIDGLAGPSEVVIVARWTESIRPWSRPTSWPRPSTTRWRRRSS